MDPSHVLAAMGIPRERAIGSLRLSLGWDTTEAEIDHALDVVPAAVAQLRDRASVSA
jgi:cysteine desulfurase